MMEGRDAPSASLFLVTGASGTLGRALISELTAEGFRVRALLEAGLPVDLPSEVQIVRGDLRASSSLEAAAVGVDCVFHLAGLTEATAGIDTGAFKAVNVDGTRNMLEAAIAASVRRFVFFSSIHVYGDEVVYMAEETARTRPISPYARSKLEAEQEVSRASQIPAANLETVILRLAAVYGPEMKGNYPKMVKALSQGYFVPIGRGQNRRTLIYIKDIPRAALLAATEPAAAGQIYNVSDGNAYQIKEIISTLCELLERRQPLLNIPQKPAIIAARFIDRGISLLGREPLLMDKVGRFTEDVAVSSRKIREQLGFAPAYSLRAGWSETIRAWQQRGFVDKMTTGSL